MLLLFIIHLLLIINYLLFLLLIIYYLLFLLLLSYFIISLLLYYIIFFIDIYIYTYILEYLTEATNSFNKKLFVAENIKKNFTAKLKVKATFEAIKKEEKMSLVFGPTSEDNNSSHLS